MELANVDDETPLMCCQTPDCDVALTIKLANRLRACYQRRECIVRRDITRGREANAIMAVNQVDDEDFPMDFVYVADYVETTAIALSTAS